MTPIHFTRHAVARFIERYAPTLTPEDALAVLEDRWKTARQVQQSLRGRERWVIDDPRCILGCKVDARTGQLVCATVLAPFFGGVLTPAQAEQFRSEIAEGEAS